MGFCPSVSPHFDRYLANPCCSAWEGREFGNREEAVIIREEHSMGRGHIDAELRRGQDFKYFRGPRHRNGHAKDGMGGDLSNGGKVDGFECQK